MKQGSVRTNATEHAISAHGTATELATSSDGYRELPDWVRSDGDYGAVIWMPDWEFVREIPGLDHPRVAWEGRAYTAKDNFPRAPATTSQQSQSVTSTAAGLDHPQGETTSPDAATEHNLGPRVLLSVADIQWHKKEEATFRPPRSLHKIARNALQKITLVHVDGDMARDLNDWFDWRRYIACHKDAKRIIGAGVTRAVAESIPGSRDSNEGWQERVNFLFTRADGTFCSVHPGGRASQDASLKFR